MSFARHAATLQALAARGRYRALTGAAGLDFASNDYLGLAGSALLADAARAAIARGVPLGAGASRLLRGNHPEHEALEAEAAAFFGAEAALFMGGGFQANQAIFATLPMAGDLVVYDALIHASAHEGMRLGRAEARGFAHNDTDDAARVIADWRARGGSGRVWIAVESVYSMQGDLAPLARLAALARDQGAVLIVDEAHATGVFGPQGRGLAHDLAQDLHDALITLHTGGKALGASGALICAPRVLIEMLVNRARGLIYATAPSPLMAAVLRAGLAALAQDGLAPDGLVAQAQARVLAARAAAAPLGLSVDSQIVAVPMGSDRRALAAAAAMQARGYDLRAIRPPTVPRGTARLRVSLTGNVTPGDIAAMFATLGTVRGAMIDGVTP